MFIITSIAYTQQSNRTIDSLIINGELHNAINYATKILESETHNTPVKLSLSKAYRLNNQINKSLTILKSIDSSEFNEKVLYEIGIVYSKLKKYDIAIDALTKIENRTNVSYKLTKNLAELYFKKENYKDALHNYLVMDSLYNHNAYTKQKIGRCYIRLKQKRNSIPYFKKAIEFDPTNIVNYEYLSTIYSSIRKKDSAIIVLESAIKSNPENAIAYYNLAEFHAGYNHLYLAIPYYEKTLSNKPSFDYYYPTLISLGSSYLETNKLSKAKKLLLKAYNIDTLALDVVSKLTRLYIKEKNNDSTLIFAIKTKHNFNTDTNKKLSIYKDLAKAYEVNKRWYDAINCYKLLCIEDNMYFMTYYYYAEIGIIYHEHLNNNKMALHYFQLALRSSKQFITPKWKKFLKTKVRTIRKEMFMNESESNT